MLILRDTRKLCHSSEFRTFCLVGWLVFFFLQLNGGVTFSPLSFLSVSSFWRCAGTLSDHHPGALVATVTPVRRQHCNLVPSTAKSVSPHLTKWCLKKKKNKSNKSVYYFSSCTYTKLGFCGWRHCTIKTNPSLDIFSRRGFVIQQF